HGKIHRRADDRRHAGDSRRSRPRPLQHGAWRQRAALQQAHAVARPAAGTGAAHVPHLHVPVPALIRRRHRGGTMVKLTRIYTRGGDWGGTSLGDGVRLSKSALRVEAMGAVDEANATIGLARLHTNNGHSTHGPDTMLERIQNDLFDLGADLATPEDGRRGE